ncbi:MAG: radical SAM protein [Candidatus Binatia bacterium]
MTNSAYTTPLSFTSQFFFCGLPLRLDSYRGCTFQCNFCYARYRGGNTPDEKILPADPGFLARRFKRIFGGHVRSSFLGQLLQHRMPLHFGGMSDPFQPAEMRYRITQQFLESLAEYNYPTVISTRSDLVLKSPYRELIRDIGHVVVQFSFVSTDTRIANRFEPHSSTPKQLLVAMEKLSSAGIQIVCRWQPFIPTVSESPRQFVRQMVNAGARHIAFEHLKLPLERSHRLWGQLTAAVDCDLFELYRRRGAVCDGREYVLPPEEKLPMVRLVREAAHEYGITFGAADNEFQFLSDTSCCCSGVDQFPGFEGWFRHQIAHAVRKCRGRRIVYEAIGSEWFPVGSVDRWLNSKTRIGQRLGDETDIRSHLRYRWNSPSLPYSPATFFGVEPTNEFTASGYRVYQWNLERVVRTFTDG